jgi:2-polyprenyl-3-methyl-5-hydroxy-6-metoxy-1,4-benzoquinol methylase
MDWNPIQLQVQSIYDKLNISFTPFFLESVQLFKKQEYKKVLDIGCGYGKHSIYLDSIGICILKVRPKGAKFMKMIFVYIQ